MKGSSVDAAVLREWLHDGGEIAVLDVRDGGPYARSHILVASSAPLAQFEVIVPQLVPRTSTRVVLVDDDESIVNRAVEMLVGAGFTNVSWLAGGNNAWDAAGHRLFSGSGIVSKAFGELVELELGTPHIEPAELATWRAEGRPFLLVDARPMAEYRTVSIPGATDCPGAELVYRVPGIIPDEETPVVVNCAGRTRSIIGAQSLRDAGIANPVFALKNGTMGWHLAGLMTAHGESNMVVEPTEMALADAKRLAGEILIREAIPVVDVEKLDEWRDDSTRTTYVFDVRQPEAFEAGHIPGSVNAPGGQLVQATDTYAAVRHARLVLVDDHRVQSVMTAHWMRRMGWDVSVLSADASMFTEKGRQTSPSLTEVDGRAAAIDADELSTMISDGSVMVIDVGESYWYRQGRIPGSVYAMRSMLPGVLRNVDRQASLVFCCSNGSVSPFAANDALGLGFVNVGYLVGGRAAWRRNGGSVDLVGDGEDDLILTPTDDMWYPPWARSEGVEEAMLQYLTWEVGLLDTVAEETYISFRIG